MDRNTMKTYFIVFKSYKNLAAPRFLIFFSSIKASLLLDTSWLHTNVQGTPRLVEGTPELLWRATLLFNELHEPV